MFFAKINQEYKYDLSEQKFRTAFAFLQREDLAELPEGWVELNDGVRASVQHYTTSPAEELAFETHENFFDIQYIVEGEELIGCRSRCGLTKKAPYDKASDNTFYEDPKNSGAVYLQKGEFVVLAPEDAHKPRCAVNLPAPVKKIVVKVPV